MVKKNGYEEDNFLILLFGWVKLYFLLFEIVCFNYKSEIVFKCL